MSEIKALEWEEVHQARSLEDPNTELQGWEAMTGFGCGYYIEIRDGRFRLTDHLYGETTFEDPDEAKAAAQADYEARIRSALVERKADPVANAMAFFAENVDRWGAAEWFDRLAKAIREQDKAVVAGDDISFETYRMIAASSAMTLVRDHETTVRATLSASPATEPACYVSKHSLADLAAEGSHVAVSTLIHKCQLRSGNGVALYAQAPALSASPSPVDSRDAEPRADTCPRTGLPHAYWPQGNCQYCGALSPALLAAKEQQP